jgi:hypothetical protein
MDVHAYAARLRRRNASSQLEASAGRHPQISTVTPEYTVTLRGKVT